MPIVKHLIISTIVMGLLCGCAATIVVPQDASGVIPQMPSKKLDESAPLTRIALGSCFVPQFEDNEIWESIKRVNPDVFLFLGDNVYQSEENGKAELLELKDAYRQLAATDPFTQLRRSTPVLPTWDDHDYGFNDAGAAFQAKYESERLFEHVWALPRHDKRRKRDGIYTSIVSGPEGRKVQFIILDTRFFRSPLIPTDTPNAVGKEKFVPNNDPDATILGEAQWEWLGKELEREADVRILVSSIQVLADGHGWEKWGNFPLERQRLFDLIKMKKAEGIVLVSGDRHVAGHYQFEEDGLYPLVELTSSALNFPMSEGEMKSHILNEPGPNRIGDLIAEANFGTLEIDWSDGSISLNIHDKSGTIVRAKKVDLDQLSY